MSELLMLVPSRGRPHQVKRLYQEFLSTTGGVSDFLVIVDDDDPCLDEYLYDSTDLRYVIQVGPRLRLGGTLNAASAQFAPGYQFLGWVGDDTVLSTPYWDVTFVNELKRLGTGFAYGDDLRQCSGIPTALVTMTSNIIQKLGYMVVPGFQHMYLDNIWKAWGDGIDRIAYFPDVINEHLHPSSRKSPWDQTYAEADSFMQSDGILWNSYVESGNLATDIEKLKELL